MVVVWDEDDGSANNHVPAIIVGQGVVPGQYNQPANHYSLLATIENMYGLPGTGGATTASTIDEVFTGVGRQANNTTQSQPPSLFQACLALYVDGAELDLDAHDVNQFIPLPSVDTLISDIRSTLPYAGPFGIAAVINGANAANNALQGTQ